MYVCIQKLLVRFRCLVWVTFTEVAESLAPSFYFRSSSASGKDLSISMGMRENCMIMGRSLLLYQFNKRGDKTDCNNYCGISLLSTLCKILSNILL
jgi:hypothetical protein